MPSSGDQWLTLAAHPSITVALGPRGSGKSAFGHMLLDRYRSRATAYVLGPPSLAKLLPREIGVIERLEDVPIGPAAVLVDEAAIPFGARDSMSSRGRRLGEALALSRQRGWSLVFISQHSRLLDVEVLFQADLIVVKGVSTIGQAHERREVRPFIDKAASAFATIQGDQREWAWVFSEKADFEGLVRCELPTYWRPALSTAYAAVGLVDPPSDAESKSAPTRPGTRTSKAELRVWAKDLVLVRHHSYRQAAKVMGVPKSTISDLVLDK